MIKKAGRVVSKQGQLQRRFSPVAAKWAISDETKKPPKTFETSDESSPKKSERIINFRETPN